MDTNLLQLHWMSAQGGEKEQGHSGCGANWKTRRRLKEKVTGSLIHLIYSKKNHRQKCTADGQGHLPMASGRENTAKAVYTPDTVQRFVKVVWERDETHPSFTGQNSLGAIPISFEVYSMQFGVSHTVFQLGIAEISCSKGAKATPDSQQTIS